jgi:hypothetical protein
MKSRLATNSSKGSFNPIPPGTRQPMRNLCRALLARVTCRAGEVNTKRPRLRDASPCAGERNEDSGDTLLGKLSPLSSQCLSRHG